MPNFYHRASISQILNEIFVSCVATDVEMIIFKDEAVKAVKP